MPGTELCFEWMKRYGTQSKRISVYTLPNLRRKNKNKGIWEDGAWKKFTLTIRLKVSEFFVVIHPEFTKETWYFCKNIKLLFWKLTASEEVLIRATWRERQNIIRRLATWKWANGNALRRNIARDNTHRNRCEGSSCRTFFKNSISYRDGR